MDKCPQSPQALVGNGHSCVHSGIPCGHSGRLCGHSGKPCGRPQFFTMSASCPQSLCGHLGYGVRACVGVFTLSNMNISETNGSIATKFYLKHHLGGGLVALGFGPDRFRTLVSMATESSHRVITVKTVSPLFLGCFSSDPFHTCR